MFKHKAVGVIALLFGVALLASLGVRAYASSNLTGEGRIIYSGYNSNDDQFGILSVAKDGSDKKTLVVAPDGQYVSSPIVSPDGTKIAYVLSDNDADPFQAALITADINGHNQTTVQELPTYYIGNIAWSPDNDKLVYIASDNDTFEQSVWTINADGSNAQEVNIAGLDADSLIRALSWGSNNSLTYSKDGILHTADPDGSNDNALTSTLSLGGAFDEAIVSSASISPDGSKIVFSAMNCPDGGGCVVLANFDGSNMHVVAQNLTLGNGCDEEQYNDASFSPDGTKILYSNTAACA